MDIAQRTSITTACSELATRYVHYVDFGELDALVELFTDDAEATLPGASVSGKEGIRGYFQAVFSSGRKFRHCLSNFLIDPQDQDRATGVVYFVAYAAMDSGEPGPLPFAGPSAVGTYHDSYLRTEAGWRIARREAVISFAARPS